jgi:hypothetical protein
MGVQVDESGRNHQARGVHLLCAVQLFARQGSNASVSNADIAYRIQPVGRVHDTAVVNNEIKFGCECRGATKHQCDDEQDNQHQSVGGGGHRAYSSCDETVPTVITLGQERQIRILAGLGEASQFKRLSFFISIRLDRGKSTQ